MKKNFIVIIIALIIIIVFSVITITLKTIVANNNENNNNENKTGNLNISKTNEISEYMPKNIKEIKLVNYMSNEDNPTIYQICDINEMEEFTNLFFETYWEKIDENEVGDLDKYFWKIELIGEKRCILNMRGIGGTESKYGIVEIENENQNNIYYIKKEIYLDIVAFKDEKYYLHKSELEIPTQAVCYKAQEKFFQQVDEKNKFEIKKVIRENHMYLERYLVDAVRLIKDKDSPYWEEFTKEGTFEDPFSGVKVYSNGKFSKILSEIVTVIDKIDFVDAKKDLSKFCSIFKEGIEENNLKKCFEAHEILHDYDYWIINTPVYLDYEPVDWGGVTTFFGKSTIIE